jgi:hypothetical protein
MGPLLFFGWHSYFKEKQLMNSHRQHLSGCLMWRQVWNMINIYFSNHPIGDQSICTRYAPSFPPPFHHIVAYHCWTLSCLRGIFVVGTNQVKLPCSLFGTVLQWVCHVLHLCSEDPKPKEELDTPSRDSTPVVHYLKRNLLIDCITSVIIQPVFSLKLPHTNSTLEGSFWGGKIKTRMLFR